jgi:hypothetical protein
MRESRTYGSVRGALSNGRPYRDRQGWLRIRRGRGKARCHGFSLLFLFASHFPQRQSEHQLDRAEQSPLLTGLSQMNGIRPAPRANSDRWINLSRGIRWPSPNGRDG